MGSLFQKCKTRRGKKNDSRDLPGKAFADHDNPDSCPVRILLFFAAKKTIHQNRPDGPLMLTIYIIFLCVSPHLAGCVTHTLGMCKSVLII